MANIGNKGYEVQLYDSRLNQINTEMQGLIPGFSTLDSNPFIIQNKALSEKLTELDNLGLDVYNSRSIHTASGYALEMLCSIFGLYRLGATKAIGDVVFTGTNGTVIPVNFQVESIAGQIYKTTTSGTIPAGGTLTLQVIANEFGEVGNASANQITVIPFALVGLTSVNNIVAMSGGSETETDPQLRKRYTIYQQGAGKSTIKAVTFAIAQVPNCTKVLVLENDTHMVNSRGDQPHSIHCYVEGGLDEDVWYAIYQSRGGGIYTNGSNVRTPPYENKYRSAFDRFIYLDLTFSVKIQVRDDLWNEEFIAQMKEDIMTSINKLDMTGNELSYAMFMNGIYARPEFSIEDLTDFQFTVTKNAVTTIYGLGDKIVFVDGEIPRIIESNITITKY